MKLSIFKPSMQIKHRIYITNELSNLTDLSLSQDEKAYADEVLGDDKSGLVRLNRYNEFIYIAVQEIGKLEAYQLSEKLRLAATNILSNLRSDKASKVLLKSLSTNLSIVDFAEGLALANYQFIKYFKDAVKKKSTLEELCFSGIEENDLKELNALISGVYHARDLVNEPLNHLSAVDLSNEAKSLLDLGVKVEVFNKKKIESLQMGGILAVNRGSQDPPSFSILEYKHPDAKNSKPIVLVGKGVVYDTGGLSLKPTAGSMDSMKSDMGGAAAVIGCMKAVALAELNVHIVGLVPATDNRPGENAYAPGDIIKMYDGTTIEVLNTDAEGRMLLADALSYAKKFDPELVIDLATLTGAAAMAIGKYGIVGMGTAGTSSFSKLQESGKNVYERVVEFPIWDEYQELLKSNVADMKNIGGREGGAITAGKFLQHFTDYPWIHLDIAGPAFLASDDHYRKTGGTGTGVRLLFDFLKNYSS